MKATKIDIKQEVLDLEPRPYYLFYRTDKDMPTHWIKENVMPSDMVRLHTEEYKVFEFYNPYAKEPRIKYLIKVKDKDLVDTLVKIEEDVLKHKLLDSSLQGHEQGWQDCKRYVKETPFWKRLFNNF